MCPARPDDYGASNTDDSQSSAQSDAQNSSKLEGHDKIGVEAPDKADDIANNSTGKNAIDDKAHDHLSAADGNTPKEATNDASNDTKGEAGTARTNKPCRRPNPATLSPAKGDIHKHIAFFAQSNKLAQACMIVHQLHFAAQAVSARFCNYAREHPYILATQILGATLSIASVTLLPALGFTALGPAANSIAAVWQAAIGNVVSGSPFAFFQSAGMGGHPALLFTGIGILGLGMLLGPQAKWIVRQLGKAVLQSLAEARDTVGEKVGEKVSGIAKVVRPVVHNVAEAASPILQHVDNGLRGVAERVGGFGAGIAAGIRWPPWSKGDKPT